MPEETYLSGKVVKQSLPALSKASAAGGAVLKRLLLPQGELAQFHDADDPVRYLAFVELREGGVRGNHYHRVKKESIYLIQGKVKLVVEDLTSHERAIVMLETGDLTVIPPGVAHALFPLGHGQAIEFSPARYDPADTFRFSVEIGPG